MTRSKRPGQGLNFSCDRVSVIVGAHSEWLVPGITNLAQQAVLIDGHLIAIETPDRPPELSGLEGIEMLVGGLDGEQIAAEAASA